MANGGIVQRIRENKLRAGVVLLFAGIGILAFSGFFEPYTASTTQLNTGSVSGGQALDYSMSGQPALFSTVTAGGTYEYEVSVENTGDVAYESMWIVSRIVSPDADVVERTESGVQGSFYAGECDAGTDEPECREAIADWNFKQTGGDSASIDCDSGTKVCTITFSDTNIEPGETKTATIELEVPEDYEGGAKFVTQPVAYVAGQQYAVAGDYDTMEQGDVGGTTIIQFLGGAAAAGGAILLALSFA